MLIGTAAFGHKVSNFSINYQQLLKFFLFFNRYITAAIANRHIHQGTPPAAERGEEGGGRVMRTVSAAATRSVSWTRRTVSRRRVTVLNTVSARASITTESAIKTESTFTVAATTESRRTVSTGIYTVRVQEAARMKNTKRSNNV